MRVPKVYSPLSIGTTPSEIRDLKGKTVEFLLIRNTSANTIYFAFEGKSNWVTVLTVTEVKISADPFFISTLWLYASAPNSTCEIVTIENIVEEEEVPYYPPLKDESEIVDDDDDDDDERS